ncbi:MAG: DUF6273 domain-containing protein [Lachnospiraceae bacterium]|nr:DUF6273 domain-containing protein [Lachnospiraceae bacterium]
MADITCKNCGTIINIKKANKGIVICPNCEVENDCSEQIYDYASEIMATAGNEVSYRAAAEAFSLIEGFRDADIYRDNCLEQADICFKDATFLRAKTEMMKGDRAGLSFACHLLESISGWKDADEQLAICKMRLEALAGKDNDSKSDVIYSRSNSGFVKKDRKSGETVNTRVKNPTDQMFLNDVHNNLNSKTKQNREKNGDAFNRSKKKKKISSLIIALVVGVVLIGALVLAYFLVIAPMLKYDNAIEMIESGNYVEGYAILTELGREDEILDDKKTRADKLIENKKYDDAYILLEETGEENKIVDSILSRVSEMVSEGKYSESLDLLGKYSYTSLSEQRFNKASSLIENAGYDEAYILLTSNSYVGSEAKRDSITNVSASLKFLKRSIGDIIEFGKCETDGNLENGKEKINWKVIDEDEDAYLLLSESVIDCIAFTGQNQNVNWTESTVRKILNLSYLNEMFNANERELVLERNVKASPNPSYGTNPGSDSISSLFLLSCDEFSRLVDEQTAKNVNAKRYETTPFGLNWWLRTPGNRDGNIAYVDKEGNMNLDGAAANTPFLVRPVMWVKKLK